MPYKKVNTSTFNKYAAEGSRQRKLNAQARRAPVRQATTKKKSAFEEAADILFASSKSRNR